jgi:hypothetical protein
LASVTATAATLNAAHIAVGQRSAVRTSIRMDARRQVWTGKRPGEEDCERLDFFVNGDPDFPDQNRLFADWERKQ